MLNQELAAVAGAARSPPVASAVGVDLSRLRASDLFWTALARNLDSVQVQLEARRLLLRRCVAVWELAEEELNKM